MDERKRKQGAASGNSDPSGKKKQKSGKSKKKFSVRKLILGIIFTGIIGAICALGVYILVMLNGAKLLDENQDKIVSSEASILFDNGDNEVTMLYRENRESVQSSEIPDLLKQAFVATEDRRFYEHSGVDFFAIGRAIVKDVIARSAVEGASTITQQLAKNLFFEKPQKTFFRKATEASIAVALENEHSKDEILTMYLNRIYFGSGAYGVKVAAKKYFGEGDLKKLNLAQIATLAALPKAPNTYSPIRNYEKSKERRAVVLKLMAEEGYITEAQRAEAAAEDLEIKNETGKKDYITFIDYVIDEAKDVYGIEEEDLLRGGYKIYTTMDANAQKVMEAAYANDKLFQAPAKDGTKIQSAMVILNNADGGLVAMIGGRDYKSKDFNRALAKRQPGSSFKPVSVYAQALESGKYNPYSILDDRKQCFGSDGSYCPNNYNNKYDEQVTMIEAIKQSKNISAVSLLQDISPLAGLNMAKKLGIPLDDKKDRNLSIALGGLTNGTSTLEMAGAYATFANNGVKNKTHAIRRIVTIEGEEKVFKQTSEKVLSPQTAYYLTQMMQTVLEPGGTGTRAKLDRPAAGKTGSAALSIKGFTKYDSDVWFVGYTPQWTAAVYEGFDKVDTKLGHYVTVGSGQPSALFKEVMSKAMAKMPKKDFVRPKGVEEMKEPPKNITDLVAEFKSETRSVQLTWSPVADATNYKVYRKGYQEELFKEIVVPENGFADTSELVPGETYMYYVTPMFGETEGEKSNLAEVEVPDLQPTPTPSPGETPLPPEGPNGTPPPSPGGGNGQSPIRMWPFYS